MGKLKGLEQAWRPPRLGITTIHPPGWKEVDGKPTYIHAKPGAINIPSDSENEKNPSSRPRAMKREHSQAPPRVDRDGRQSREHRIKPESSGGRHGKLQIHGQTPPAAATSDTRRTKVNEPPRRREGRKRSAPPRDSPPSSDPSESDSSDSSSDSDECGSSSDSSSSEDSSSGDEATTSVYRPTTPASSIGPSPPRTRGKKDTGVRRASADLVTASPSRRWMQDEASIRSGHAPLDFFIDLPARPSLGRPELASRPRSQTSSVVAPTGAQVDRTACPNHPRPNNSSPVIQGFMPINRGSPPPHNAPTEPRAMRTGEGRTMGMPMRSAQRPSESMAGSVSGSSSIPFRGPRPVEDNLQQKGQRRRGPARRGRIMQTIEQPPVELPTTSSPLKNALSSRDSRAATPGPSSSRTAPPPPTTPGIFTTPRSVSARPSSVAQNHDTPQSVSRPRGKRTFDETEGTDSTSKAAEWERMLERFQNHEREMEQQRAQLEETKRLLAEQKSRIDELEQRRRSEELVHHASVQTRVEEPEVAPLPVVVRRDVIPAPVPSHQAERREEQRRQNSCHAERRDKRNRRKSSRVARARIQEQERERIEQERQEELEIERQLEQERERIERERQENLELEQQLEQEQRRQAERIQCAARNLSNNAQQDHPRPRPAQRRPELLGADQRRIQHDVFNRPLSGLNPGIFFDDEDRGHISEATAFLMRLSQSFVLARLRRLVEGKEFFDTAHPGSTHLGCWVVSRRASCDLRMKLTDSGESHNISFSRLAVRLWHDALSLYRLLEHHNHQLKAGHTCHLDACMRPDHIVVESDRHAGERRRCKAQGRCYGHRTVNKDGTSHVRKPCIFPPRVAPVRQ